MKKLLTITLSTLLALTLFSGCVANKADETLSPNPPTEGSTKANSTDEITEEIKATVPEATPETKKAEEVNTAAPQTEPPATPSSKPKAQETRKAVEQNKPTKKAETTTAVSTTRKEFNVSRDEAKAIALSHAGLAETDISRYKSELDRERKSIVYEIEFDSGKFEYEYEVNADTGKVIKAEKERRD